MSIRALAPATLTAWHTIHNRQYSWNIAIAHLHFVISYGFYWKWCRMSGARYQAHSYCAKWNEQWRAHRGKNRMQKMHAYIISDIQNWMSNRNERLWLSTHKISHTKKTGRRLYFIAISCLASILLRWRHGIIKHNNCHIANILQFCINCDNEDHSNGSYLAGSIIIISLLWKVVCGRCSDSIFVSFAAML